MFINKKYKTHFPSKEDNSSLYDYEGDEIKQQILNRLAYYYYNFYADRRIYAQYRPEEEVSDTFQVEEGDWS